MDKKIKLQKMIKTLKAMRTFYASYSDSERSDALGTAIYILEDKLNNNDFESLERCEN